MKKLKSPYPYFGGKARVADAVWARLGDPVNYIEPFCGSLAVALGRKTPARIETFNDLDCYLANFWRAIKADPVAVARFAKWPVNEADLHSRHRWLVGYERPEPFVPPRFERTGLLREAYLAGYLGTARSYADAFREKMRHDPDYYDPKLAGWWVWGLCCWIGGGWCKVDEVGGSKPGSKIPDISGKDGGSGKGVNQVSMGARPTEKVPQLTKPLGAGGVNQSTTEERRPKISGSKNGTHYGNGIHAKGPTDKRPMLGAAQNPHGERTHLGVGVHSKGPSDAHRPQLADAFSRVRGVHGNDADESPDAREQWLIGWFSELSERFRVARVCCGDWKRVCESESVTTRLGMTAVFLDPPYRKELEDGSKNRAEGLYANDETQDVNGLVDDVIAYCKDRGSDRQMRIAVCGYQGEGYEVLKELGWSVFAWKSSGGYASRGKGVNENASRERIWFSPHCLDPNRGSPTLFEI